MKPMKQMAAGALGLALGMMTNGTALADTFGTGANTFTIDFVNVGNAGNVNDVGPNGGPYGGVAYDFRMGTYEVSEDMITKANAEGSLGIAKDTRGVDKPATSVSWNEAARFVNWMNTSKGYSAAYKFTLQPGDGSYSANANIILWQVGDAGYNAANLYRNSNAFYFLPSENEWYKAAYYSGSGTTYFDYATQQNIGNAPTAVSGGAFGAVYNGQSGPADVANAGGSSFYGTEAQNGNAWEWNESAFDGSNNSSSELRAVRGGNWDFTEFNLRSSVRSSLRPSLESDTRGFRVASVPEPSTALMILIPVGAWLLRRRPSRSL